MENIILYSRNALYIIINAIILPYWNNCAFLCSNINVIEVKHVLATMYKLMFGMRFLPLN